MSTCPICHAPTTPKLHNCAYCGVSLNDRKQKAPSQAAPALLTRPSSQEDPLSLEVSATPASELSTMNLTMDSVNDSHEPFTLDLSGSEDDALVIETPLPQLVVQEIEPENTTPDVHSTMAQFSQEAQYSYVPSTEQYFSEPQRPIEPRLATIDEASDGLGPLDVDLDQHQLVFPDEPVIGSTRSTAKLSDLSGVNPLSGVATPALEPSFDIHNSALSQAISSSAHHVHTPILTREETATLSPKSSMRLLSQGLLFIAFTLAVLWGLGLNESLLGSSSWFNQQAAPKPNQVALNLSRPASTNSKASNEIRTLGDQSINSAKKELSAESTSNIEEDEIVFDNKKIESESAKPIETVKKNGQEVKSKTLSKAKTQKPKPLAKKPSSPKKRSLSYSGLIQQGEKLLMRGRVKQAESYFKKAFKLNPSKAEALAQLAWCQLAKKNTRSAIGKFKQALSKNPVHGDSLYGLGYSYEKLKESKQAIHYFELYLKRYPNGKQVGVIKNKMRHLKRQRLLSKKDPPKLDTQQPFPQWDVKGTPMSKAKLEEIQNTIAEQVSQAESLRSKDIIDCFTPILWEGDQIRLIDQRKLPSEEIDYICTDWVSTAKAIKDMVVRGAPAIGITAAYGLVLAAKSVPNGSEHSSYVDVLEEAAEGLSQTRPTAVNLFWAIEKLRKIWQEATLTSDLVKALESAAVQIHLEDIATCRLMGAYGASIMGEHCNILTHCNTGALATGGHGTALGVIRSTYEQGKLQQVYADETRPFWQGARLTAWELHRDQIPVKVITDSMSAHLMSLGKIDAVFVGADRIAANGDAANKIGTYLLAIVAAAHQVPFYVVAPKSTVDLNTASGEAIPIERRPDREVTHCGDYRMVPEGVEVENPAFDVTPANLITAIITEEGIIPQENFAQGLADLFMG